MSVRRVMVAMLVVGAALGVAFAPHTGPVATSAAWLDRGSGEIGLTAIVEPPVAGEVVIPDPDADPATSFVAPPTWTAILPTQFCFDVDVATESADLAPWSVVIHSAMPPFNQAGPPFGEIVGSFYPEQYVVVEAADYAETGDIVVSPVGSWQWASATQPYHLTFCAQNVPPPAWQPEGPGTWELVDTQLVRNGTQPCVVLTIRGHLPYFVGYAATFDWEAVLVAQATESEQEAWLGLTHWDGTAPGQSNGASGATGADYQVTLTAHNPNLRYVSDIQDVVISSCAY